MLEKYTFSGAGIALLDHKTYDDSPEILSRAGGITPNVIATINNLENNSIARIFACVGNDEYGDIYTSQSQKLLGLKMFIGGKTGYSENKFSGHKVIKSQAFYNCATDFQILDSDLELNRQPVFITDVFTLQLQNRLKDIQRMAKYIESRNGFVALNLAGVTHLNGTIGEILNTYQLQPNLIFGNSKEFKHIKNSLDINNILTKATVQVETMGESGSVVQFRNTHRLQIQANLIEPHKLIDEFGAGDTYMGTFISGMFQREVLDWTPEFVYKVATISSLAASLVLQTTANRIRLDEAQYIKSLLKSV